jgi:Mg-chelatase subunit ChlD
MFLSKPRIAHRTRIIGFALLATLTTLFSGLAAAQAGYGFAQSGAYGFKIYKVESGLYPFVQVYFRTFDSNGKPLVNLNEMNIGVMVKGRSYDPMKRQYFVQSIRQREEATRTVLIMDASGSMRGRPFNSAMRAAARFIDSKRPQDEIAILAIRDSDEGYQKVSTFERDPAALGRRLADVRPDGKRTRLYDTVGAAMQMCGMSSQGSVAPSAGNYIISCSLVIFSDGRDEGSAVSRAELMSRITNLKIPLPIYSLAYTKTYTKYFKNLEALSKNSFGKYYLIGKTYNQMQMVVEEIQEILQNDYVVVFRSFIDIDGEEHVFKIGIDYPARSGKYIYQSGKFEAIDPPPVPALLEQIDLLSKYLPALPDGVKPYFQRK